MKKVLLLTAVAFVFTACNKCKECTDEDYNGDNYEWTVYQEDGSEETFGDQIIEICSDDFESKKEFKDYIKALEDEGARL